MDRGKARENAILVVTEGIGGGIGMSAGSADCRVWWCLVVRVVLVGVRHA